MIFSFHNNIKKKDGKFEKLLFGISILVIVFLIIRNIFHLF